MLLCAATHANEVGDEGENLKPFRLSTDADRANLRRARPLGSVGTRTFA